MHFSTWTQSLDWVSGLDYNNFFTAISFDPSKYVCTCTVFVMLLQNNTDRYFTPKVNPYPHNQEQSVSHLKVSKLT